jgi:hypothetical protein
MCTTPEEASETSSAMFEDILSDKDALGSDRELIRQTLPTLSSVFDALDNKKEKLLAILDWMAHGVNVEQSEPAHRFTNSAHERAMLSVLVIRYCGVDARVIFHEDQVYVRFRMVTVFPCIIQLKSTTPLSESDGLVSECDQQESNKCTMDDVVDQRLDSMTFPDSSAEPVSLAAPTRPMDVNATPRPLTGWPGKVCRSKRVLVPHQTLTNPMWTPPPRPIYHAKTGVSSKDATLSRMAISDRVDRMESSMGPLL